jgi:hypothetical protein
MKYRENNDVLILSDLFSEACSRCVTSDSTVFAGIKGSPDRNRLATIDIFVALSSSKSFERRIAALVRLESARSLINACLSRPDDNDAKDVDAEEVGEDKCFLTGLRRRGRGLIFLPHVANT